jgi:hypothetical protein
MYDDLYTKAPLLRKRSGIVLRCISQVSAIVALVLFAIISTKHADRYGIADIAITYILFTGGFLLDVCAVITILASARTWAWLEAEGYRRLAYMSKSLLCSKIFGSPETRPLWSGTMGQYHSFKSPAKAAAIARYSLLRQGAAICVHVQFSRYIPL